jgi:hypothetical protein
MRKRSASAYSFVIMTIFGIVSLAAQSPSGRPQQKPHTNHIPQHGGVFFMALDNKHHLEGVLLPSRMFRVYLYDAYTKPLSAAKVTQASGTVQIGESDNAPRVPLVVGKDGRTLEASLGEDLKLPVTLTLSLHLPDVAPNARPEVFTFPFSHFIAEDAPRRPSAPMAHSGNGTSGMKMDH